ncbi:histidinol-phosphate transaminase [Demequina muriae]|uniref:Aromatic amino acid aminotransferase n=1 Tax=Demequina muriae TaxID=3051664 RepID=A0ABT8GG82_9MICO|nr:histidinol-phosphate transaminase [Demequina sp. EGI L300058]MDN4480448.1 histidinol-phosphate transaminase [Demequina sp. EGI L300058]
MDLPRPRPAIAALPTYVPGARGDADRLPPVKLSSNETPYPPLPMVAAAIAGAGEVAHRYPDMFAVELHERIGAHLGLSAASVAVGGGSVAALQHVLQAYTGPGDEVIFPWRSFEAYPILTAITGATAVTVPLTSEARHDLDAMAAAVTDATRVLVLCSPNNPTGPAVRLEEFERLMATVPRRVLVVLDEAYVEFVRDAHAVDGLAALSRHPNLLIARTFSKAYGLAALRVGYVAGAEELIAPVKSCVTPFSVSAPAQVAALVSLDARDELMERVETVVAERARVADALRESGWDVPDAQGNFVWLPAGQRTGEVAHALAALEPAILVRPFAGEGMRVTIGTRDENDALLAALERL